MSVATVAVEEEVWSPGDVLDLSTQMPTVICEARAVLTLSMHCFSPPLLSRKSRLLIGQAGAP